MSRPIIEVEKLGKCYRIGAIRDRYLSLRDELAKRARHISSVFSRILSKDQIQPTFKETDFWALLDVTLSIQEGETVGIIGRNGAGKSTLLKILSQITPPTRGQITMRGRVASLLEVGTGFHPELTGGENIFLNGAILGMSRVEIRKKFDEIVAFAEIEKFLNTPVKRYSSGMYVRLAFAVAAHLEPEILLIDEVLAVGDAQFQKKCLGKMGEVAAGGRSILFVSHNMTALQSLCTRAVWLEKGQVMKDAGTSEVVSEYLQLGSRNIIGQQWKNVQEAPGNDKVRLRSAKLIAENDDVNTLTVKSQFSMEFSFWNLGNDVTLNFSMHLYNIEGLLVLNSCSNPAIFQKGVVKGICTIPGDFLNDGVYKVMIMITKDGTSPVFVYHDCLVFDIHDIEREGCWYGKWGGIVRPNLRWKLKFQDFIDIQKHK